MKTREWESVRRLKIQIDSFSTVIIDYSSRIPIEVFRLNFAGWALVVLLLVRSGKYTHSLSSDRTAVLDDVA